MSEQESGRSFGQTVLAIVVLAVAGWILLHVILNALSWLLSIVVVVAAVIAVVWAWRELTSD